MEMHLSFFLFFVFNQFVEHPLFSKERTVIRSPGKRHVNSVAVGLAYKRIQETFCLAVYKPCSTMRCRTYSASTKGHKRLFSAFSFIQWVRR